VFKAPQVEFEATQYETRQLFFTSRDGTRVPMFVTCRKGLVQDGRNRTLLGGYGGFDIPLTPAFSATLIPWLERGGICAVANLRGGGEYGEEWHEAGMFEKKQNVFDDFIGAAEYLIREGYTTPSRLAIEGGSNGGLLVGAVMTQRPDLLGVALPAVGVMDMLRFHKFTIGWAWVSEYGSADNASQFPVLKAYSPLHNLKPETDYPATLITTADHDDRVVPAHSFKFAAALQAATVWRRPAYIRIETKAGHGAGKPISKIIDAQADVYAFALANLAPQGPTG
jgi:prolyl oligopeptidase